MLWALVYVAVEDIYISVRAGTYIGTYEAGHNNMSSLLSEPQTVGS